MKDKIVYFLNRSGFKKLFANDEGIDLFFSIENGFVTAILISDLATANNFSKEQYDQFQNKASWRFMDGGCVEVHMLSLFITKDLDYVRENFYTDNRFCWCIDSDQNQLIIDQSQVEDFYGVKEVINQALNFTGEIPNENLVHQEFDAKGKPYYKDVRQRPFMTHLIFIINAFAFTGCVLTGNILYDRGMLNFTQFFKGEYYRLFTCMFLHADMSHLLGNMLILYILGEIVERAMGHIKFLIFYLLSGMLASFASLGFCYLSNNFTSSLGASGAIFGIIGALLWIALRNHGQIEIMTTRKILFLIGFSVYSGFVGTNIDNAAHIGGLIGGFLLAMLFYRKRVK